VIAGHFGLAAAVKARRPAVPLWGLMLATQWLDVAFVPLVLAKVEGLTPLVPPGYGRVIIHADYTHSLLGALVLAAVYGGAWALRRGRSAGLVLGATAFSHWLLDLVVHRGDMPFLPGNAGHLPRLGFGLWRFPAAAALVELAMVVAGSALYWRAARATGGSPARARLCGAVCLGAGLVVLALDLLGL
jgi:membrane-bound metal-dependent hydrolase YbcI (DUF457 family)